MLVRDPWTIANGFLTPTMKIKRAVIRDEQHWKAGQEFVFIPKGKGVLLMPVPELAELAGIARGAKAEAYRDRRDRY